MLLSHFATGRQISYASGLISYAFSTSTKAYVTAADHFAILDRAKRVALTCARDILGVTSGRLLPSIPNLSNKERRLQGRLLLLRIVRRDIYTRQGAGQCPRAPSRAIKRAWDATLFLQLAAFSQLWDLWRAH